MFIDTGSIAEQVKLVCPGGFDKVLELVGTTTLLNSLRCAKQRGIVCMTGMVGNKWWFDRFSPMEAIPTAVSLTTYDGGPEDFILTPLDDLVDKIAAGQLRVQVGRTFRLGPDRRSPSLHGRKPGGRQDRRADLTPWPKGRRQPPANASLYPDPARPGRIARCVQSKVEAAANPFAALLRLGRSFSADFDQFAAVSLRRARRRSNLKWTIAQRPGIASLRSQ